MNIGIVTTWFERGAAYVSRQYFNTLIEKHNVFIFARGGEEYAVGNIEWDKDYVTWAKKSLRYPYPTAFDIHYFEKWLKENKIELVIFNEQHWWLPVKKCNDLKIITGCYIDYYTKRTISYFDSFDFLISNTKRHYSVFNKHKQSYYIPWGTDQNLFNSFKREEYIKTKPQNSPLVFFHSAGFNPFRKGTDYVIKAFNNIVDENVKLIIHTQKKIEEFFPELAETISKLVDNNKLEIIEKSVKAPGLYYLGDIYVYPSRLDGIGLTLAEAISTGLFVITTDQAPMNEFVKDKTVGKLVKIKGSYKRVDDYFWPMVEIDIEDLTNQMKDCVKNWRKDTSKQIIDYANKNLDWGKNSRVLLNIVEKVKYITSDSKQESLQKAISHFTAKDFVKIYLKKVFKKK